MRRKEKQRGAAQVLTTEQLDRVLSRIASAAAVLGFAVAALLFVVLSLLLPVALYPWNEVLFAVQLVLLLLYALLTLRLRRYLKAPVRAYPKAAEYYAQTVAASRGFPIVPLLLLGSGLALSVYGIFFTEYGEATTLYTVCISLTVTGALFTVFRLTKQAFYRKLTLCRVEDEANKDNFNHHAEQKRIARKWSIYWVLVLGIYLAASLYFRNFHMYALIPILAAINFLLRLLVNNPFRRFASVRSKRLSVHFLNLCSLVLTVCLCFSIIAKGTNVNEAYIASLDYSVFSHHSSFTYDKESGVYTLRSDNEEFRILQLTDIHICGSLSTVLTDRAAFDACYAMIREAQPDLILVTGDIAYTIPIQTFSRDNLLPIYQFCTFLNNTGIPWAMVYGNHDTEAAAGCTAEELSRLYQEYFLRQPDCPMLYADVRPEIYGRYNQYLRIENPDGSLNRLLFLIDSNDYVQGIDAKKYDSVHKDQIAWYEQTIDTVSAQEGRLVPSFVFMHIPFRAYRDAYEALQSGSEEAEYLFGKNEESVSCPDHDTGFFDSILEKGSTEAVFVGHDHVNYLGVKYQGIDLVYSKSIDYIAYPKISKMTAQRGATLITLSQDGTYAIQQLDYTK